MKTLLLILLGVFTFAYVANTAPVSNKFEADKIQDLLNALSKESDTAEYDDSQSDDEDDDDSDEGADDAPQTADERGPDSLALVSRIQADIQDLLNVLSMSDVDESSSIGDEQDEDEGDDSDEGAGEFMTAQAKDEYYDDGQPDSLALRVQAMQSAALLESLPAKARARLLDYMMKVAQLPDQDQADAQFLWIPPEYWKSG